jgi:two-component system sensor kinase FixL
MAAIAPEARRLTVRTRVLERTWVQISVIDSGPGFAAEQYERLFEPFYTTKAHGLGLGLSISRAIIRAHGGRVWGGAEPGRGTSFHIALPSLAAKR